MEEKMKLIIKDYISSLNEDVGLNDLIPKLLFLNGINVVNNAQKGVRQYGVDIFAEKKGEAYLVTIKQGNINRNNWNTDPTALRQSLDDIFDVYIPKNLPQKYRSKPIHIIIAFNGVVEQAVQEALTGYEGNHPSCIFEEWNLDFLTGLVYDNLLNENLLPKSEASLFRKCLALINDEDYKMGLFNKLSITLLESLNKENSQKQIIRNIRKIILMQKILCEWDNESNVFLNKIKSCELMLLNITRILLSQGKRKLDYIAFFNSIKDIYIEQMGRYYGNACKLLNTYRSLSTYDEFGHRVKLYEILGVLSMYGILLQEGKDSKDANRIANVHDLIINIFKNYDAVNYIPLETNCSEISIILLFLYNCKDYESVRGIVMTLLQYQRLNYEITKNFPFPYDDYYEALSNIRDKKTPFTSTVVLENLYEWQILVEDEKECDISIKTCEKTFDGISFQLWLYGVNEELLFYKGEKRIGTTFVMPKYKSVKQYKKVLLKIVRKIKIKDYISEKKNIRYVPLIASRLYRMPVNPYLYLQDLK